MFIAIYRWKIKDGMENQFIKGWKRRTEEIYKKCGSFGSRLHLSEEGSYVAYAQWPSKEVWQACWQLPGDDQEAQDLMKKSIEKSLSSIYMETVVDLLKPSA